MEVLSWSQKDRTRRALKFWLSCWGASIVCIAFPLVHFVLVPGFFLAGPALAFWIYAQQSVIRGGSGPCPYCAATVAIARGPEAFPLTDLCTACHRELKIHRAS